MMHYQAISEAVFKIFERYTPDIEPLSIDEAFLDLTHAQRLFGSGQAIAKQLQAAIFNELHLTCSIGIAPNKFLAKLASEEQKPNGCFCVPLEPTQCLAWLGKKTIRQLWGVGPKLAEQLEAHGLFTVRDIQYCDPHRLAEWTTPRLAHHLTEIAFGRDHRLVISEHEEKSFSREHTYNVDTTNYDILKKDLRWIAEDVANRLRSHHLWARVGRLKIRYAGFRTVTRQKIFPTPVCDNQALRDMAWALLESHLEPNMPVRLIGFGAEDFYDAPLAEATLFSEAHPRLRQEKLSHTLDQLRKRYKDQI
jgi:DNA polymerase-4